MQTTTLLDSINEYQFDCAIGGARRDEEKARAKERFFSHRDDFGQWDQKIKDLSCGIYLMARRIMENISEHFL